jgi:hypothetical protein
MEIQPKFNSRKKKKNFKRKNEVPQSKGPAWLMYDACV